MEEVVVVEREGGEKRKAPGSSGKNVESDRGRVIYPVRCASIQIKHARITRLRHHSSLQYHLYVLHPMRIFRPKRIDDPLEPVCQTALFLVTFIGLEVQNIPDIPAVGLVTKKLHAIDGEHQGGVIALDLAGLHNIEMVGTVQGVRS
jgi:hypothetical protein